MNSHQRRQIRRLYRHTVQTMHTNYGDYLEAWQWLKQRHGLGSLSKKTYWYECFTDWQDQHNEQAFKINWHFQRSRDAMEFALRWS